MAAYDSLMQGVKQWFGVPSSIACMLMRGGVALPPKALISVVPQKSHVDADSVNNSKECSCKMYTH